MDTSGQAGPITFWLWPENVDLTQKLNFDVKDSQNLDDKDEGEADQGTGEG